MISVNTPKSLRAYKEPGEVITRRRLHRHPSGSHHRTVGQHDLEPQHLVAHNPVADGVRTARVGGGHPPQRGVPPGIYREKEAVYLKAFVQLAVRYPRLDPGDEVLGPNLQDLVHQT